MASAGDGIRHRERADARAPQRRQVAADAERRAEVAGEGTDVGAAGAVDDDIELDACVGLRRTSSTSNRETIDLRSASTTSSPARARS